MTPPPHFARRWITAGCLFGALIPLGFLVGVIVNTYWLHPHQVGYDQIGNALGGGFLGVMALLLIGGLCVRRLTPRGRFTAAVLATLAASLCLIYLRSSAEDRRAARTQASPSTEVTSEADQSPEPLEPNLTPKDPVPTR